MANREMNQTSMPDRIQSFCRRFSHLFSLQHLRTRSERSILLIDSDGLSNYTSYLARGISRHKSVVLYGFSKESYVQTGASKERRVKFYWMKKPLPKGYSTSKGIVRVLLLFFVISIMLVKTKYDTVHVQEHLPTFFFFIPLLKLLRKQICWTLHDVEIFLPRKGIRGILQISFLKTVSQPYLMERYSDLIIVHASALQRHLISKGIPSKKIHVIPHCDYEYLISEKKGTLSSPVTINHYILFFGNIAPWKGVETLISASRIVRERLGRDFDLLLAGSSFYQDQDVPYLKFLTHEDRKYIHIYNKYIPSSEIPDLFNRALFVVLPYTNAFKYSVSGIIPLAYTFSKPVIVSNVDSLAEYVEHGKTGFIFDVGDSMQLAEYMIELLENNSKCIEMGKNANRKLLHEMSLEKCCKMLNDLYDRR